MAKMTIEEAIKYIKDVVQKNKRNKEKNTIIIPNSFISSDDCAEKYGQVAKWLEELKFYRDKAKDRLAKSPYNPGDDVYCVERLMKYQVCGYKYLAEVKGYIIVYMPYANMDESVDESLTEMHKHSQSWYRLDAIIFDKQHVFATRKEAEKKAEELENNAK